MHVFKVRTLSSGIVGNIGPLAAILSQKMLQKQHTDIYRINGFLFDKFSHIQHQLMTNVMLPHCTCLITIQIGLHQSLLFPMLKMRLSGYF